MIPEGTVLILGSAPDVVRAREWPRTGIGVIVAINNAWKVRPDWNVMVHPKDFTPERWPERLGPCQRLVSHPEYVPAVNAFGGMVYCGGTMAFTAGYWALHALRPRLLAFLGCDMIYAASGRTHFYGRGSADPLRADPTLQSLEAKSARLAIHAAEAGCAVVNLSELPASRLALPRASHGQLAGWIAEDGRRVCGRVLGQAARALAAEARSQEAALGNLAPSGKYWRHLEEIDAEALARIDALWLSALGDFSVAA